MLWYCWWTKSCTTKDDDYPIIYRVLTTPGGAGFCPSTVSWTILESFGFFFLKAVFEGDDSQPVTSHRWNPESLWKATMQNTYINKWKKHLSRRCFFYDFLGVRLCLKDFYWLGSVLFACDFGETKTSQILYHQLRLRRPSSPKRPAVYSPLFLSAMSREFPDDVVTTTDFGWLKNRPSIGYQFHDDFIEIRPGSSVHSTSVR